MSSPLPDLQTATAEDEDLRQVVIDQDVFTRGVALAEERLLLARAANDRRETARVLGYLGDAHRILRHTDLAIDLLTNALTIAQELGDQWVSIANLIRLGETHRYRNDLSAAEPLFRDALRLARDAGERTYEGFALQHLGKCLIDAGAYSEAVAVLDQALAIRRATGRDDLVASTERALARAKLGLEPVA